MPFGVGWQEGTLDSPLTLVVGLDLGKKVEAVTQGRQLGILLEMGRPDTLEVAYCLRSAEISNGKVAKEPILVA